MTSRNHNPSTPPAPPADPMLSCTVLVARTKIGPLLRGKGAKVRLPKWQAEALASLSPPRVRIDGV